MKEIYGGTDPEARLSITDRATALPQHDYQCRSIENGKTRFEQELFQNGTLEYNENELLAKVQNRLQMQVELASVFLRDEKARTEAFARTVNNANYEFHWFQRFSGRVPEHWNIKYAVSNDFRRARELGVALSPTLVTAGITHPSWDVAEDCGRGQRLTVTQLSWLFLRPDMPQWSRDEVIAAQREKGIKEEELRAARQLANELRTRIIPNSISRGKTDDISINTANAFVELRHGEFISTDFSNDAISQSVKHVFIGDILFTRQSNGRFRYSSRKGENGDNRQLDIHNQPSILGTERMQRALLVGASPSFKLRRLIEEHGARRPTFHTHNSRTLNVA